MKEYQNNTSITNLIEQTMANLRVLTDNSTIFGEATYIPDGTSIIPVSKLTVGFVIGGGEYADLSNRRVATNYPMAGGSSGGVSISPVGFIVNTPSEIKFVSTESALISEEIMSKAFKFAEALKDKIIKK